MQKKSFWVIVVVIAIITVGVFLVLNFGNKIATASTKLGVKEFNVSAFKYGFNPNIITVKQGNKVKINITNADILHGINVPDLRVSGNDVIEFTADKKGEFTWYCNNYCGTGHGSMQGKLIVQ
jgi:cytochrome c oxidase subunit 2